MTAVSSITRLETLEFMVEVEGSHMHCFVTIAALKSRFGATDETAARALLDNLAELRAVALQVAGRSASGERIIVRSNDFS